MCRWLQGQQIASQAYADGGRRRRGQCPAAPALVGRIVAFLALSWGRCGAKACAVVGTHSFACPMLFQWPINCCVRHSIFEACHWKTDGASRFERPRAGGGTTTAGAGKRNHGIAGWGSTDSAVVRPITSLLFRAGPCPRGPGVKGDPAVPPTFSPTLAPSGDAVSPAGQAPAAPDADDEPCTGILRASQCPYCWGPETD
jgi:hypothetical protein